MKELLIRYFKTHKHIGCENCCDCLIGNRNLIRFNISLDKTNYRYNNEYDCCINFICLLLDKIFGMDEKSIQKEIGKNNNFVSCDAIIKYILNLLDKIKKENYSMDIE